MSGCPPADAMPTRLASILSLLAFAAAVAAGGLVADNPLSTTVWRALVAMAATFGVGLVVGHMARRMVAESLDAHAAELDADRQAALERALAADPPPPTVGSTVG